jgi:hypothetical protein
VVLAMIALRSIESTANYRDMIPFDAPDSLFFKIGDLMRYAVSPAEQFQVGPQRVLPAEAKRVEARSTNELFYAPALYIYSLEPPRNPNPFDANAKAGQKIFAREGCTHCHSPALYTSNKLTLTEGFTPPLTSQPAWMRCRFLWVPIRAWP